MEIIGKLLFGGAFLTAVIAHLIIVFLAFRIRVSAGFYCLFVTPIYAFTSDIREDRRIARILPLWLSAFALMILGVILLGMIT